MGVLGGRSLPNTPISSYFKEIPKDTAPFLLTDG